MGVVVFFLVRGLSTTIHAAKHDLVRARFTQVLFIYLPTFLGKFALLLLHTVHPSFYLNEWQLFFWIILVDILPTIAVVFSFRYAAPPRRTGWGLTRAVLAERRQQSLRCRTTR